MADIFDQYSHARRKQNPIIYAYSDTRFPGCLKIGYTTRSVDDRMKEHYPTITPDVSHEVVLTREAMKADGSTFMDHDVHRVLEHKKIPHVGGEWYRCSVSDVEAAIVDVVTGSIHYDNRTATFRMRPEQARAVALTRDYYELERANDAHPPKFLWNAKMRFGKTFASYQLAKSMGFQKILILTFKPAVEASWEEDLNSHVDFTGWQFYTRNSPQQPEDLDPERPLVCFGSFQDYLGRDSGGGIKARNEWVHATHWDLIIFDEYHFGAWGDNAKNLFDQGDDERELDIETYARNVAGNEYDESFLPITANHYLYLSGTPFRALNSGEFMEDQIFSWTYGDEQREKQEWDDNNGPNPYLALPEMVMLTYQMPAEIRRVATNEAYNEFDLNLFFHAEPKADTKDIVFERKEYVQKWLDMMRGQYNVVDDLALGQKQKPVMPFSDVRMLGLLGHTLWYLPDVASCHAMANLLAEPQNRFYQNYKVIVCAGSVAGIGLRALDPVKQHMADPLTSKTITLTCGKLTTGVTVKPWTGILMLRNLSSPESYFQAAFRVQSPWTLKKEDGSVEILKHNCYVFDFALDRALRQISDYSCRLKVDESNPEKKVQEFVNFLPVLAFDGSTMKEVDATEILDITTAGTSATLLARKWQSALLVNVDNDTLERLMADPAAMQALMNIEGFRNLNKDIETIINKSDMVKKAKAEGGEKTKQEKKELSEAEKEFKTKRKQIQENLIKFATRVPVFMYLTDYREHSLKDVITQLEPGLFKAVTGLGVADFELLVSLGVFNDGVMNDAVYKFKRYEDSSLNYIGVNKHANDRNVGLFSTAVSKDTYESMSNQQRASTVYVAPPTPKSDTPQEPRRVRIPRVAIGDTVEHTTFGVGTIVMVTTQADKRYINVCFASDDEVRRFHIPDVFESGIMIKK